MPGTEGSLQVLQRCDRAVAPKPFSIRIHPHPKRSFTLPAAQAAVATVVGRITVDARSLICLASFATHCGPPTVWKPLGFGVGKKLKFALPAPNLKVSFSVSWRGRASVSSGKQLITRSVSSTRISDDENENVNV